MSANALLARTRPARWPAGKLPQSDNTASEQVENEQHRREGETRGGRGGRTAGEATWGRGKLTPSGKAGRLPRRRRRRRDEVAALRGRAVRERGRKEGGRECMRAHVFPLSRSSPHFSRNSSLRIGTEERSQPPSPTPPTGRLHHRELRFKVIVVHHCPPPHPASIRPPKERDTC